MFREKNKDKDVIIDNSLKKLPTLVRNKKISELKYIVSIAKLHFGNDWHNRVGSRDEVKQALNIAVKFSQDDIVDFFVNEGVSDVMILLPYMAAGNNIEMVKKLLNICKLQRISSIYPNYNPITAALVHAVDNGATEVVNLLLEAGASPNTNCQIINRDWDYRYILSVAITNGHLEIAENLVKHGAWITRAINVVERDNFQLLEKCKREEKDELVVRVADLEAEYRRILKTFFDLTIGINVELENNDDKLSWIRDGMDVSGFNFVGLSINGFPIRREDLKKYNVKGLDKAYFTVKEWENNLSSYQLGVRDNFRYHALTKRLTNMQKLRGELVDKAGIVDVVKLSAAVEHGNHAAVEVRLSAGIDPNSDPSIEWPTPVTCSPLIIAATKNNDKKTVAALLASPKIKVKCTDIMRAWSIASDNGVSALLKQHIPDDQLDSNNNTVLHYAVIKNDINEITRLVNLNVNLSPLNKLNESPLHLAVKNEFFEAVKLLVTKESLQVMHERYISLSKMIIVPTILETCVIINELNIFIFLLSKCEELNVSVDYLYLVKWSITCNKYDALKMLLPKLDKKEGWDADLFLWGEATSEILSLLLEHGADINRIDSRRRSLIAETVCNATDFLIKQNQCNDLNFAYRHFQNKQLEYLSSEYEARLKLFTSKGACFSENENKDELIESFKKALEPYGKDAGQSFLALLNEVGVYVSKKEITCRPS